MKLINLFLFFFTSSYLISQEVPKFNLGFENNLNNDTLGGWIKWGNYNVTIDTISKSGLRSGKVTSDGYGTSFGSIAYKIPANYEGKIIKLEGFMKIKNVNKGFAGLLMRIDGDNGVLEFDNMRKQRIGGTSDWQKYSLVLDYPKEARFIYVAGILKGKGEAWFDNFSITIDDKNIQTLKEIKKKNSLITIDSIYKYSSSFSIPDLSDNKIKELALIGKIWGFLKYHHPKITKGNYNWDFELLKFLNQFQKLENDSRKYKLLLNWISSYGKVEATNLFREKNIENIAIKPDLEWIYNTTNKDLRKVLLHIHKNRSQGKQRYVKMTPTAGNPKFIENSYSKIKFPHTGLRLLSLFRYWNIIQYYFPYKNIIGKDWNNILTTYIPIFINTKNELEYEIATLKLIGEVNDTHANLWKGGDKLNEIRGNNYAPFEVRFIEDSLVVTGKRDSELMNSYGVNVGDIIIKINEKPINEIVQKKLNYYPASNHSTKLRDISEDILRSNEKSINISFINSNKKILKKEIKLYPKDSVDFFKQHDDRNEKSYQILDQNIGYVTLKNIKEIDVTIIKEEFKNTKGIIIDIRNYPSYFVPFKLGAYFVSSTRPFAKFSQGSLNTPGEFLFTENVYLEPENITYNKKLIILVNEQTQSQAEYTAMAFKAGNNTKIIGSTTAGADGNSSSIVLPGGLITMISGIGVFYPDGKETQRIGILPDVPIKPTINGVRKGKDEILEKAIDMILKD